MNIKTNMLILALTTLFMGDAFCQLQDPDNLIFLYMNGTASNPDQAKDAYIINSDGNILHQWDNSNITSPETAPGYLTPDGLFLRGVKSAGAQPSDFSVGVWGTIQLVDYSGTVVWEYDGFVDGVECFHHDIELLPNGNILASAFRHYDENDAAQQFGWNVTGQGKLLCDVIYEIEPDLISGTSQIVWQWNWVDHVIQDGNPSLPNYGVIADHPEKIDLHFYDSGSPFLPILLGTHSHINSVDYNPTRDEILISSGTNDEIYIIDHSTTTAEAATSNGGNSGKGGDILYRWGNPQVYDYGGGSPATYSSWRWTKTQHDVRWLLDGSGNITIHNNNSTTDPSPSGLNAWSQFLEITVPYNSNDYSYTAGQPFGPSTPIILAEYNPSNPLFNCVFSGGGQKLQNGHVFTTSASQFTLLEHDENGQIEWSFDMTTLHPPGGQVFKAQKHPITYTGFDPLFTNSIEEAEEAENLFQISYSDIDGEISITHTFNATMPISCNLVDLSGKIVFSSSEKQYAPGDVIKIDLKNLPSNGMYILNLLSKKISVNKRVFVTN